jgi:hypothetical protein
MGTGAGFDLQTASTLFWKAVPVSVRSPEREDQTETLTFRILTGVLRSNHNMRVSFNNCTLPRMFAPGGSPLSRVGRRFCASTSHQSLTCTSCIHWKSARRIFRA